MGKPAAAESRQANTLPIARWHFTARAALQRTFIGDDRPTSGKL